MSLVNLFAALTLTAAPLEPSACYAVEPVSFASLDADITIAGEVIVPAGGPDKKPAILMITGNGPHTRDQMISGNATFAMLSDFFVRRGYVVMRNDARGFGGSTGPDNDELTITPERINDNRAALARLREHPSVDPARIILFGHSEGGMIASELAGENPDLALTILLSTSAIPGDEVFSYQQTAGLRRRGMNSEAAAVREQLRRYARYFSSGREDPAEFRAIATDFLRAHGPQAANLDPTVGENAIKGFAGSRWMRWFVGYDPRPALSRIRTPVLAIYGELDENTVAIEHMPSLVSALTAGQTKDYSAVLLPQQDHFYLEFDGQALPRHRPGEMVIASELYDLLSAELGRRFGVATPCVG